MYVRCRIGIIYPRQVSVSVFNRWGELVFQSDDAAFAWDGSYKGARQTGPLTTNVPIVAILATGGHDMYLLRSLLLLCITVLLCSAQAHATTGADSSYAGYMQQCDDYIHHYQPQYTGGQNAPLLARVPDSLNEWLISRALAHDYAPLKYACALILLQNQELSATELHDLPISGGMMPERNGFVVLLREAMGRGHVSDNIHDAEYLPFYTADLCYWIRHNKRKITDYEYLESLPARK